MGHLCAPALHEGLQLSGKPPLLGCSAAAKPVSMRSVPAQGSVYGWFDGEFTVSRDRGRWETRSPIGLVDFAMSPDGDDLIACLRASQT